MLALKPDEGTTLQATLSGNPSQIINARKNRSGVLLVNLSAVDVFIGFNNSVSISSGCLLPAGKGSWFFYPVESALWGVINTTQGNSAQVSAMEIL